MGGMDPHTEDDLNASFPFAPPQLTALLSLTIYYTMEQLSQTMESVSRYLARLCDGDHIIYLRTDPHTFNEFHRSGRRELFTSIVAAFIPNVVIKLQVPSLIYAATSRQNEGVQDLLIPFVESFSEIVSLVQDHKAAFIREDSALSVWANELPTALASLQQVLGELGASSENGADHVADNWAPEEQVSFDGAFMRSPVGKISEEIAYLELQRLVFQPLRLDDCFDDSFPIGDDNCHSSSSLMLDESIYRSSSALTSTSPISSPGASDWSSSTSTPHTIAPSELSSPPMWDSPLPPMATIFASSELASETIPISQTTDTQEYALVPNSQNRPTSTISPAASPSLHAAVNARMTSEIKNALWDGDQCKNSVPHDCSSEHASDMAVELRELSDETSKLAIKLAELDDEASELAFESDDEDDDYLPQPGRGTTIFALPSSPTFRKAVSRKIAAHKTSTRRRKRSSFGGCRKKPKSEPKKGICPWCALTLSRANDVGRHVKSGCTRSSLRQPHRCSLCEQVLTREDAVLRHMGSAKCRKQQIALGRVPVGRPAVARPATRRRTRS